MQCEKCKKRDATVHLTEIIKNVKSEIHLCEICAKEFGLNSKLSNFSLSVPEMLSFLDIQEVGEIDDIHVCQNCGMTHFDYRKTGVLGCPECYRHLRTGLQAVITGFHGGSRHIGKVPSRFIDIQTPQKVLVECSTQVAEKLESLPELKRRLEHAISEERYEDAAILRDAICELEKEG